MHNDLGGTNMSTSHRKSLQRAVAALASATIGIGLLATGVGTSAAAPSGLPKVGECFVLTEKQVDAASWSSSAKRVDCNEPHSIEVVSLRQVPKDVAKYGVQSGTQLSWLFKTCQRDIGDYVGVSSYFEAFIPRTRTALNAFSPTKKAWEKGDRTVVCTAENVKSRMKADGSIVPTLEKGSIKGDDYYGPGTIIQRKFAGFSGIYGLMAMRSLYKKPGQKYPGEEAAKKQALQYCQSRIEVTKWLYTYPLEEDWNTGYRFAQCWQARG